MAMPAAVEASMAKLEPKMQKAFRRDFKKRKKSIMTAYVAWLMIGWHYLYLGKTGLQFAFWFTLGGCFFWWFFDAFRVPGLVARTNEDMARELMTQYRVMA